MWVTDLRLKTNQEGPIRGQQNVQKLIPARGKNVCLKTRTLYVPFLGEDEKKKKLAQNNCGDVGLLTHRVRSDRGNES